MNTKAEQMFKCNGFVVDSVCGNDCIHSKAHKKTSICDDLLCANCIPVKQDEQKKCPRCEGNGILQHDFIRDAKYKCPECEGTGKVKQEHSGEGDIEQLIEDFVCFDCKDKNEKCELLKCDRYYDLAASIDALRKPKQPTPKQQDSEIGSKLDKESRNVLANVLWYFRRKKCNSEKDIHKLLNYCIDLIGAWHERNKG